MYEPCSDFRKVLWWSVSIWKRWKGGFSLLMTPLCHVDWISTCGHRCLFTSKQQIYDSAVCFFYEAQALWGWMELIICHLFCNCIWRLHSFFFFLFFLLFSACSKGAFHSRLGSPWSIYSWIDSKLCKIAAICLQLRNILMKCFTSICRFLFFFSPTVRQISAQMSLWIEKVAANLVSPPLSTPLNSAIYGSTQASTLSLT